MKRRFLIIGIFLVIAILASPIFVTKKTQLVPDINLESFLPAQIIKSQNHKHELTVPNTNTKTETTEIIIDTNATTEKAPGIKPKSTQLDTTDNPPRDTAETDKPTTSIPAPVIIDEDVYIKEIEKLINQKTNQFRINNNLSPFLIDYSLEINATNYSLKMLADEYLSHVDKNGCDLSCRFKKDNYTARSWGENLAYMNFEERPSAEYVANFFISKWQASSGHLKNLLDPNFTQTGIGLAMDKNNIYATVQFSLPIE